MSHYSFHSCDARGMVARSRKVVCRDDLDALAEGVRRSAVHAVEIFQGSRLVARVKPGNAPLDPTDLYSLWRMAEEIRFRSIIRTGAGAEPHFPVLLETVEQALDHVQELPVAILDLSHWRTASRALWDAVDFPRDAARLTAAGLALCAALAAEGWLDEIPLA